MIAADAADAADPDGRLVDLLAQVGALEAVLLRIERCVLHPVSEWRALIEVRLAIAAWRAGEYPATAPPPTRLS